MRDAWPLPAWSLQALSYPPAPQATLVVPAHMLVRGTNSQTQRYWMKTRTLLLFAGFLCALTLAAADWPQWRGPDRNDVSKETGLLKASPTGGPKPLWT